MSEALPGRGCLGLGADGWCLVQWRARLFDSRWKSRNLNGTQLSRKPLHLYLRAELHDTIGGNGEVFGSASGVL